MFILGVKPVQMLLMVNRILQLGNHRVLAPQLVRKIFLWDTMPDIVILTDTAIFLLVTSLE